MYPKRTKRRPAKPARRIVLPILPTYLAMIRGSVGSKMFRHLYANVNGKRLDILRNGELSCALFVSSLLFPFGLLSELHATVLGTLKDLKSSGWRRTNELRPGAVLLWKDITYPDGETHEHVGFYVGNQKAVSNSTRRRTPAIHYWTFGKRGTRTYRPIQSAYWHPKLKD